MINKTKLIILVTFLLFSSNTFPATFKDSLAAYYKKDYDLAYSIYLPLANGGNKDAQYNLGVLIEPTL